MNIKPGTFGTAQTTVNEQNTAKAVGSGSLPVFATPMMVALMEQAAVNALTLEEGQTSVGTSVEVSHTAASALGAEITAKAVVEAVDGRSVALTLTAFDESGEIGSGRHTRFIVDTDRFMSKVAGRAGGV